MESKKRMCIVCRKEYSFCPRCPQDASKPKWMFIYCSENCKKISRVMSDFENETITRDEALEQLSVLDLSRESFFENSYKASLEKIKSVNIAKDDLIVEIAKDSDKTEDTVDNVPEKAEIKENTTSEEKNGANIKKFNNKYKNVNFKNSQQKSH